MHKEIGLYELNNRIKSVVDGAFTGNVRVVAEISQINENKSGHCYLTLIEKSEGSDAIKAQARAVIWSYTYRMLKPFFESATGRRLEAGMKVLLSVEVVFHELYGFNLKVKDIDPSYTLGDIERRRREVLLKLKQDGIIDMNKSLDLPVHIKNIAVISSPTAAGYGDFINQLENNSYGFSFAYKLFPAVMQGDKAERSLINALDDIAGYENVFDVVVMIRGGGATSDLNCFDSYDLSANIAQYPIPVISGIGHERDITIVDRVANTRVKTPTAAAEFIITKAVQFASFIEEFEMDVRFYIERKISDSKAEIRHCLAGFAPTVRSLLSDNKRNIYLCASKLNSKSLLFCNHKTISLNEYTHRLVRGLHQLIKDNVADLETAERNISKLSEIKLAREKETLKHYESVVKMSDPVNLLKKGYSLTYNNGKLIKSVQDIKKGDILVTRVADGEIVNSVSKIIEK